MSAKVRLQIAAGTPAEKAVRQVLSSLDAVREANEAGVREALDSEHLHDFRVAVRRTRSVLGQLRGTLAPAAHGTFAPQLRWLGRATGAVRDLDVLLLALPSYLGNLPAEAAAALEPLGALAHRRRAAEQQRLVSLLDSARYRDLGRRWRAFLDDPEEARGSDGGRPAEQVVAERVWRVGSKVMKRGGRLGPSSPSGAIHRLRIDCKKLRYLLELFRSLLPEEPAAALVGALKGLQDELGLYQDLSQHERLLEELATARPLPPEGLLAAGRLASELRSRRRAARPAILASVERLGGVSQRRRLDRASAARRRGELR